MNERENDLPDDTLPENDDTEFIEDLNPDENELPDLILSGDDEEPLKTDGAKKEKSNILLIGVFALIVVAASIFAFYQMDKMSKDYIFIYDGSKVGVEDLSLFLMLGQGNSVDYAVEGLIDYSVLGKAAKDLGIILTEEEIATVTDGIGSLNEYLAAQGLEMPDIPDSRLIEILSIDFLYPKLTESVSAGYVVDETDFEAEWEAAWLEYEGQIGEVSTEDIEGLKASFRDYYIQLHKSEYFMAEFDSWKANAAIEVNQKALEPFYEAANAE